MAVVIIHTGLLAWGAKVHSPTLNEPGHLVAGIYNWQFGKFDVYRVNPPLTRMVASLPVLAVGADTNWETYHEGPGARPEFSLGEDLVAANGERSIWLFTLARWACIPFSWIGAYICFRWAQALYGDLAGLLALTLWCFCPNILAHGQVITSDVTATSLGLAACYTFWQWLKKPSWWHTFLSGAALGLAELAKTTLIIFYPLWPVLWVIYRWPDRHQMNPHIWLMEFGKLAVRMTVGLYVINLGYGFEGTCTRLGNFSFVSTSFGSKDGTSEVPDGGGNRFANSWLESVPVPLPSNYVLGIDHQRKDFENYYEPSYLRGQFQENGWWYYYLYALAIKVPLGTWLLILLAAMSGVRSRANVLWRDEFILVAPAIIILAFVSSQTGFSEHMRYVLPIFPFFFVWISRASIVLTPTANKESDHTKPAHFRGQILRRRLFGGIVIGSLAWSVGSSLTVYPHNLSYFNELVGGPIGGANHLIHSNVDWGQDLLFLKKWLDKHPEAKPLKLAYFGYFDPIYAGIKYSAPEVPAVKEGENPEEAKIPPGLYAISVNFVRGLPYFAYQSNGLKTSYELKELARFQQLEPVAMAGYSICIYRIE